MGTPEFSAPTLEALHQHHEIIAVYTQMPKPAGRGQAETLSPIHKLANKLNLPVYTPKSLRKAEAQAEFAALKADCTVVIAYGLILPREVLTACPYGCINIHPSLLPSYRGAAPMQRSILAGEKETAMCIMQMDEGIDTGDILLMEKVKLDDFITYSQLSNDMSHLGAKLLLQVLDNIDNITPEKQPIDGSYANKITKEEAELHWEENSEVLLRKVRVLNPWPGTFFYYNGEKIKVFDAKITHEKHNHNPGSIIDEKNLVIACTKGSFQPIILQRPGKKAMPATEFLKGFKLQNQICR
jgi:methionyl-tRNA formyltransferase